MNDLLLNVFICVIGLALHFSMKWREARQASLAKKILPPSAIDFIRDTPAQSSISVLGTIGVFTVMTAMDWMNPGCAFASGYLGNSMADNLVNRFSQVPK